MTYVVCGRDFNQSINQPISVSSVSLTESSDVSSYFHYHVDEDVAEGSVVADLSLDFIRLYHVDDVDQRSRLRFLLLLDQSTDALAVMRRFDLDDSGVLTTSTLPGRRLDREELCDAADCLLTLDVVVQPYFLPVKVKVELMDVNDNVPVIELADDGIQLYESAEVGTELYVASARDLDSRRHGIGSCRLENTHQYVDVVEHQDYDRHRGTPTSRWSVRAALTHQSSSRWLLVDVAMMCVWSTCTFVSYRRWTESNTATFWSADLPCSLALL